MEPLSCLSAATWSPWRGDLYGAEVVRRLVCGSSYKVVVEAIVAEFEQLHEETVLRLIVQVQVLPRSLKTNREPESASVFSPAVVCLCVVGAGWLYFSPAGARLKFSNVFMIPDTLTLILCLFCCVCANCHKLIIHNLWLQVRRCEERRS